MPVGAAPSDVSHHLRRWGFRRPRPDSTVSCAAPFVAMEFGAYGTVQACCANAMFPIGDVRTQTLTEIWQGRRAALLRSAMAAEQLGPGCGVCRFRIEHTPGELPRDYYDQFGFAGGEPPEWPRILAFSLHNTCNLGCIMCGGDESSRIRTQRDGLPPLPHAYGDDFFEQLDPFLANCDFADFVGGEPFLVREHQRVWDRLIELDRPVRCSVATNGTVWNARVERVLDALDLQVTVSVDGITRSTFERVREGASYEEVFRNIERFRASTLERGRPFMLSFSLVRQNWFELGSLLRWAADRDIPVKVQTVLEPEFGVQGAPTDELRRIIAGLEDEDAEVRPHLGVNAHVWDRELQRLHDELSHRSAPGSVLRQMRGPAEDNSAQVLRTLLTGPRGAPSNGPSRTRRDELLGPWVEPGRATVAMTIGPGGTVTAAGNFVTLVPNGRPTPTEVIGRQFDVLLDELAEPWGGGVWLLEEFVEDDLVEHLLFLGRKVRDKVGLVVRLISWRHDDLTVSVELASSFALVDPPERDPGPVVVSIGPTRSARSRP